MAEKRKAGGKPFQKGTDPRRNPGGRPRDAISLAHWLREWGGMTPEQAGEMCATYARELKAVKGDVPLAALAALRVWIAVINEPSPGLFSQLLDRIDGPVVNKSEISGPNGEPNKLIIEVVRHGNANGAAEHPDTAPSAGTNQAGGAEV